MLSNKLNGSQGKVQRRLKHFAKWHQHSSVSQYMFVYFQVAQLQFVLNMLLCRHFCTVASQHDSPGLLVTLCGVCSPSFSPEACMFS